MGTSVSRVVSHRFRGPVLGYPLRAGEGRVQRRSSVEGE